MSRAAPRQRWRRLTAKSACSARGRVIMAAARRRRGLPYGARPDFPAWRDLRLDHRDLTIRALPAGSATPACAPACCDHRLWCFGIGIAALGADPRPCSMVLPRQFQPLTDLDSSRANIEMVPGTTDRADRGSGRPRRRDDRWRSRKCGLVMERVERSARACCSSCSRKTARTPASTSSAEWPKDFQEIPDARVTFSAVGRRRHRARYFGDAGRLRSRGAAEHRADTGRTDEGRSRARSRRASRPTSSGPNW